MFCFLRKCYNKINKVTHPTFDILSNSLRFWHTKRKTRKEKVMSVSKILAYKKLKKMPLR